MTKASTKLPSNGAKQRRTNKLGTEKGTGEGRGDDYNVFRLLESDNSSVCAAWRQSFVLSDSRVIEQRAQIATLHCEGRSGPVASP
jgi:hypothetical protein